MPLSSESQSPVPNLTLFIMLLSIINKLFIYCLLCETVSQNAGADTIQNIKRTRFQCTLQCNVFHSIRYSTFYYKSHLSCRSGLFLELPHDGMMCNTAGNDIVSALFSPINKRHRVTRMSHHFFFLPCSITTPDNILITFQAHSQRQILTFCILLHTYLYIIITDTFKQIFTRTNKQALDTLNILLEYKRHILCKLAFINHN